MRTRDLGIVIGERPTPPTPRSRSRDGLTVHALDHDLLRTVLATWSQESR